MKIEINPKKCAEAAAAGIRALFCADLLPAGATLDTREANTIAADAVRFAAARNYWRTLLTTVSFPLNDSAETPPWLAFSQEAKRSNGDEILKKRKSIHSNDGFAGAKIHPIGVLDAMVSIDEIARHLGSHAQPSISGYGADTLIGDIRFMLSQPDRIATLGDQQRAGRGLLGAREIYDVAHRFQFASQKIQTSQMRVDFGELLALHRAEGTFCLPPPEKSLIQGPLILTGSSTARASQTVMPVDKDPEVVVERPGFCMQLPLGSGIAVEDRKSLAIKMNLLGLGGLDNLAHWAIDFHDKANELFSTLVAAETSAAIGTRTFISKANAWLNSVSAPHPRAEVRTILGGLLMAAVEDFPPPGTLNPLFDGQGIRIDRLRAIALDLRGSALSVMDNDARDCAREILGLAWQWYMSRTRPETLLAWRDRPFAPTTPRFSPFVSYLRYHSGDVIFVGILLRVLYNLPKLEKAWNQLLNRAPFRKYAGEDNRNLLTALAESDYAQIPRTRNTLDPFKPLLDVWSDNNKARYDMSRGESVWRHVGLIDTLSKTYRAPWMTPAPAPQADIKELADTVKSLVERLQAYHLMEVVNRALEFTPVETLKDNDAITSLNRKNFYKAENFERLRLFYDEARNQANLDFKGIEE